MKLLNLVMALYLCAAACRTTAATELHVSPNAQPGGDGSGDKPFATLAQARDAIRTIKKAKGLPDGGVTVWLHDGTFRLLEPFLLREEDSGTPEAPIVYAAFKNAKPIISGGRLITGWKADESRPGVFKAVLTDPPEQIRELYVNNRWATRAGRDVEIPDKKLIKQGKTAGFWWWKEVGDGYDVPADVATWKNLGDVEVIGIGMFRHQVGPIDSLTAPNHVRMDPDYWHWQHAHKWGPARRIENALELLDEPGEWYFDRRAGVVYYFPLADEQMDLVEVMAPRLERLVAFDRAAYISLTGLQFSHATWLRPRSWSHIQATAFLHGPADTAYEHWCGGPGLHRFPNSIHWKNTPGNISLEYSREIVVERCRFVGLGGTALALGLGCHRNRVLACDFTDIAAAGIRIGTTSSPELAEPDRVVDNRVEGCRIANVGRSYWGSTGIETYYTVGTILRGNDVHHLPYTAISVGWGWGSHVDRAGKDSTQTLARPLVEGNYVTGAMLRNHDGGGIYLLGPQPDGRVAGNAIIDVGRGIYPDEGTSFITFEDNVCGGFHFNNSSGNTLLRNFTRGGLGKAGNGQDPGQVIAIGEKAPWPPEALAIIAAAGTGPLRRHLAVHCDFAHGLHNAGYGPDASPIAEPAFTTIEGRPCVRFDGSGAAIAINAGGLLLDHMTEGTTLSFWVRPEGVGRQVLVDGGANFPRIELVDGVLAVTPRIGLGALRSPAALPENRWSQVIFAAGTRDGSDFRLLINGTEAARTKGNGRGSFTDRIMIGRPLTADADQPQPRFTGAIADLRIYDIRVPDQAVEEMTEKK